MKEWIGIIQFLLASAGHGVLVIRSHNWWYGTGLGRRTIDFIQLAHGLLFVAGPVSLWWVVSHSDPESWLLTQTELLIALYGFLCGLVALYFLGLTVWRLVRPKAA